MSFQYTRADFITSLNERVHNRKGMFTDINAFVNESVRATNGILDMRPTRRKAALDPNLFTNVYRYAVPADLKKERIIDIEPQVNTEQGHRYYMVNSEEFSRLRRRGDGLVAVDEYNGTRTLLVSSTVSNKSFLIAGLDTLASGGGTWELFGDAENLASDSDYYVEGNGSIKWDISSAGGTTAGIKNTGLNSFDLDNEYLGGDGVAFIYVYLNSATDVTNFVLRLGSSESTYHSKTITSAHNSTAFASGLNLLRFDLTSLVDTGTPDDNAITYAAIYMTKASGKISETDYRFDQLILRKGKHYNLKYYSSYPWQNTSSVYLQNSTDDSDLLIAEDEEYEIQVTAAEERAFRVLVEPASALEAGSRLRDLIKKYKMDYPSESLLMSNEYRNF